MGVPFLPTKCQLGSDIMKYNSNLKQIPCPFTDQPIAIATAVLPDVGIIHVQRADAEGNAQKWGTLGIDREGIHYLQEDHPHEIGEGIANWYRSL